MRVNTHRDPAHTYAHTHTAQEVAAQEVAAVCAMNQ